MEKTNRIYTEDQIDLLIGQLKGTRYVADAQKVLADQGKKYSGGYIQRVFGKFSYSEPVWDALKTVALARKQKRKNVADESNQLVSETV